MKYPDSFKHLAERFMSAGPSHDYEDAGRRKLFTIFSVGVFVPLLMFGVIHLRNGLYQYTVPLFAVAISLTALVLVLRSLGNGRHVYRAAIVIIIGLLGLWLHLGTMRGSGTLWILAGPPFAYFLMGRKEGTFWTALLGSLAALFFLNPGGALSAFSYDTDYALRHLFAYTIISLFIYNYESTRERYRDAMLDERKKLIVEKDRLAATTRELVEANALLSAEVAVREGTEDELRKHRDDLERIVAARTIEIQEKNTELAWSERRYRLLADNANDIIWSLDRDLSVSYISPSIRKMVGYTVEEAMPISIRDWFTPESIATLEDFYNSHLTAENGAGGDPPPHLTVETSQRRKDGASIDVEVTVSPMWDSDGRIVGVVGITRDVSERTRALREKERIQQQLAQSQKMEAIGTLVAGIAHDFNNFLGGIVGSFDILARILAKENLRDRESVEHYLEIGAEGSKRSAGLIRQLLAISRKHEIVLVPMDINDCLKHVLELCKNSFPKSVELDIEIGDGPLTVMGDAVQAEQVLLNLCINASQAMTIMRPEGAEQGGVLTVRAREAGPDRYLRSFPGGKGTGRWALIEISDTGVGMSDEDRGRLFEPFFTKKKLKGTGLGLSTSYGIVRRHGGAINVYSEEGKGTRFSVYFPLHDGGDAAVADGGQADIVRGAGTVLIIDDEPMIINVATAFLTQCGYEVLSAPGPIEGIELFSERHAGISAVIIDLCMPGKSGIEVFQELKAIDPGVRAILSSGMIDTETGIAARQIGIRDTIGKPYLAGELSRKIQSVIG